MSTDESANSDGFICPECPRETPTATGLKTHWTRIHGGDYPEELLAQVPNTGTKYDERTFKCEFCGESFTREVAKGESRRFCSRSCQVKHYHENNDITQPLENARKGALERDNYECQRCGVAVEDGHRESQRSAEVHHLIPKTAGGSDDLANLVTLCLRCHKTAHREMGALAEHHPDVLEELREVICHTD